MIPFGASLFDFNSHIRKDCPVIFKSSTVPHFYQVTREKKSNLLKNKRHCISLKKFMTQV